MRLVNLLFVVAALAVSAGAAHIFFKAGDIDPAAKELVRLETMIARELVPAGAGDGRAQYRVAEIYRTAAEPLRNYRKAHKWYRKAADQGHTLSQFALGEMYAKGQGVQQNYYRAAEWYRLASSLSRHAGAQFSLGELYFNGRGVASSYGLAIEWYSKAANQGHAVAQFYLGQINKEGWGVEKNLVEAYKWLALANDHADQVRAHNERNDPKRALSQLISKMNSSQIKSGKRAYVDWKSRH